MYLRLIWKFVILEILLVIVPQPRLWSVFPVGRIAPFRATSHSILRARIEVMMFLVFPHRTAVCPSTFTDENACHG